MTRASLLVPLAFVALAVAAWPSASWYAGELDRAPFALVPLALFAWHVASGRGASAVLRRRDAATSSSVGAAPSGGPSGEPSGDSFRRSNAGSRARRAFAVATVAVLAYAVTHPVLPAVFAAAWIAVAAAALGSAVRGARAFEPGLGALALLALPVVPELQLTIGYPLRVCAAEAATWILRAGGSIVDRAGATLVIGGERVVVDAPCSGVSMWWAALLVAAWWATRAESGWRRTAIAGGAATVAVLFANGLRSAALVRVAPLSIELPPWMHEGVGLVCFAACVLPVVWWLDRRVERSASCAAA